MPYYGFCLPSIYTPRIIRDVSVSTWPHASWKGSGPAGDPEVPRAGLAGPFSWAEPSPPRVQHDAQGTAMVRGRRPVQVRRPSHWLPQFPSL